MNNAKYNDESTANVFKGIINSIRNDVGDLQLARSIASDIGGKIYIYFDGLFYQVFVKVSDRTYFCISHCCCYDMDDVDNDPRFYEWEKYVMTYPGKALVVEDYFSPIKRDK